MEWFTLKFFELLLDNDIGKGTVDQDSFEFE